MNPITPAAVYIIKEHWSMLERTIQYNNNNSYDNNAFV